MGLFRITARLSGPTGRQEDVELLVDTGATFLVIPSELAARLDLQPTRNCPLQLAGGREETWPLAEVRVGIDGHEVTTPCVIAPEGPALLGAVALESLLLAVDPIAKRLLPVKGFIGPTGREVELALEAARFGVVRCLEQRHEDVGRVRPDDRGPPVAGFEHVHTDGSRDQQQDISSSDTIVVSHADGAGGGE